MSFTPSDDSLKVVVLSDLHLIPQGKLSFGIDTNAQLVNAIDHIHTKHDDADLCLFIGDLTDRSDDESYHFLKDQLDRLMIPYGLTIGNHDSRLVFERVFGKDHTNETGFLDRAIDLKGHRLIMLDSAMDARPHGELRPIQLEWLKDQLNQAKDKPVVVFLHHHVLVLHTAVDRIMLANGDELLEILKTHNDVRQVISGHVHYTSTSIWHGIPFSTIAGSHYSIAVSVRDNRKSRRMTGPAQMGVILSNSEHTTLHFDNFIDGNEVIKRR